jgi:hypothetical protein
METEMLEKLMNGFIRLKSRVEAFKASKHPLLITHNLLRLF